MKNIALKIALVAGVAVGGVASLAVADEVYSSIAVAEPLDENTSATIAYALGGSDLAETDKAALAECKRDGGARCYVAYRTAVPICVAIAEGIEEQNQTVKAWGVGDTNAIARSGAVKSCKDRGPIGAKCRVTTPHNQCAVASNPSIADLLIGTWEGGYAVRQYSGEEWVYYTTIHIDRKEDNRQLSGSMHSTLANDNCSARQSAKIYVDGAKVEIHGTVQSTTCTEWYANRFYFKLSPSGHKLNGETIDSQRTAGLDVTLYKQ